MNIIKGDLVELFLEGEFDILIHGCNCKNAMGAGIAGQIANKIPEAYLADLTYDKFKYDIDKLSNYSYAPVRRKSGIGYVVNLYTQYNPGPDLDENALLLGFTKLTKKILSDPSNFNIKIGIPEIGCGIAGGDWKEIGPKIDKIMEKYNLTLVQYEPIRKTELNVMK